MIDGAANCETPIDSRSGLEKPFGRLTFSA
jgi:hypothetical protein